MARLLLTTALAALVPFAAAQTQMESQVATRSRPTTKAEASKISPEQKKYGMELLKIAEADAGNLEGGMRAWGLWQLARGYEPIDKAKALELLQSALTASRAIEDDGRINTRVRMQEQILRMMVPLAPEQVDELLTQVDPKAREKVLIALLSYYEKNKEDGRVRETIYRIAAESDFPYDAANRVMERMSPEQAGDMLQLFTAALASYRDHADEHADRLNTDGFTRMVTTYWRKLPKEAVRQAIDEILKQSDPANQKQQGKPTISMASDKGSVSFSSMYEFQLFQLMPVIRELDPGAAEAYLKKYRELATMVDKYPDGTASLAPQRPEPDAQQKGKPSGATTFMVNGSSDQMAAKMAEMHRAQKLVADAEAGHAGDAMANASGIADQGLRANCYEGIARATLKNQSSIARSAIEKMLEISDKMSAADQVQNLRTASDLYLQMGDTDSAKKTIEKGIVAADKAYTEDVNADDPNKALKAYWPATNAYRALLTQAGQISPMWALSLLKEISDPEVKFAAESALAGGWLNVPLGQTMIMTQKKGKSMLMTRDLD